jgi:rod shape-determining protein MreC
MDNLMGRYRNVSILAAAIFVQILGLAVQVKRSTDNQSSRLIRVWAVSAITPLEKTIVSVQTGIADLWHNYFYLRGVRQENRELKQQIEDLQLERVRLEQDANQAHRLQALLGFKEQFIAKTLAAQVIGSSGSEQSRTVYIDKGSREGVQPDMAVISANGVVGKVISVYKNTSQVLLINDQQSGVGAILEQSRLQGVLKGKSSGGLVIDKIMADEEVIAGDKVLTSGGDEIFPKGLIIGTVSKIEKGPEFLQVSVKPNAALNRLEEVLVIIRKEEREPVATAAGARAADILAQRLPSVPDKPAAPVNPPGSASHGNPAPGAIATHRLVPGANPSSAASAQLKAAVKPVASVPKPLVDSSPGSNQAAMAPRSKPATPASASPAAPGAAAKLPSPTASKPVAGTATPQPQSDTSGDRPQ